VVEEVQARIDRQRLPVARLGMRMGVIGLAMTLPVILAALLVWHWPSRSPSQTARASHADQVCVAQQAGVALGYIGSVLLEAGRHSENVLLKEAVPPLRNGFEATSKILNNKL
jgi:hypothetical protein